MKYVGLLIALVLVIAGAIYFTSTNKKTPAAPVEQTTTSTPQTSPESVASSPDVPVVYQGTKLAGTSSLYLVFNQTDYDTALKAGKTIVLDFFANWCPICRAEAPELKAGFNALTSDRVVGFRVNYNDSDTDADEQALAKQFKIPYQHTKVIIKDGKEVARYPEQWNKEMFLAEVGKFLP